MAVAKPRETVELQAIARVLDTSPVSGRRVLVWGLAASGIGLDGFDLFIMTAAGPIIVADFGLDPWQKALAVGAAVIGAVPGAIISGRIADRIGRRRMMALDLILFIVSAILSACAWNIWALVAFRLLQGAAIGAEYPLSSSYISEVMPARSRGRWMTGAFAFQAVGMILGAGVGFLVLELDPSLGAWRWMLLAGVVPAVIVAIMRTRVPESPRWEAQYGHPKRAERATVWLTGVAPTPTDADRKAAEKVLLGNPPANELFRPRHRRALALTSVPWFLMDIALYGVGLFTTSILLMLLAPSASSDTTFVSDDFVGQVKMATAAASLTDLFLVAGFLINMILVERAGRIRLQIIGFLGMAVGMGVLAWQGKAGEAFLVLGAFAIFNLFLNAGPNATTYLLAAEAFPTRIRAQGAGLAAAAGKAGAVIGTFLLPMATSWFGLGPALGVIAALCVAGAIVTWSLRITTTGGVDLPDQ